MRHAVNENEIEVLKRCLSGSGESFEWIVGRYQSLVCGMTFASTGNLGKSEELAQETFILAWKNLRQLRDLTKFKSWLCQIARNVVQNWRRSAQRDVIEHAFPLEHDIAPGPSRTEPVELAIQEEERAVMNQAIDAMPEKYRLALILFYREDKSSREVAQLVDLSENATRQRIARARAMLKDQVAAMVERNLAQSKPGKAFTGAVVASLAGVTMKGAATAVAAGAGVWAVSAGLSSLTVKITAVAAGLAVLAGTTYTIHNQRSSKPIPESVQSPVLAVGPGPLEVDAHSPAQKAIPESDGARTVDSGTPDLAVASVDEGANPSSDASPIMPSVVKDPLVDCANCLVLTIVDKDSGEPLPGVKLNIRQDSNSQTGVTNNHGQFQILFDGTKPDNLRITATAGGRVPTRVTFYKRESDVIPEQLSMRVEKGTSIGGLIRNEEGEPIAGSSIFLLVPNEQYPDLEKPAIWDHEVITDAKGHWQCDVMPKTLEDVWIRLAHADYIDDTTYGATEKPTMAELRAKTGMMVMRKGVHVAGWVFNHENEPLADATVAQGSDRWGSHYPQTKTNAEGYFEFQNAEPDSEMILTVQAKGYSPDLQSILPRSGMKDTLFSLEPGHEVRGLIVDANNAPIAGAFIAADTWRGHRSVKWRRNSDEQGIFVWKDAPDDEVLFDMGKQGYMTVRNHPMMAGSAEYTIMLKRPLKVLGTVRYGDSNEPVTDYTVTSGTLGQDRRRPYWSKRDAKSFQKPQFEKTFSEPREYGYMLRIEAPNYAPVVSRVISPEEERVRIDFVLNPLEAGAGMQGTVLLPDGSVAAGIDVALATTDRSLYIENGNISQKRERLYYAATESDGRFSMSTPDQNYRIAAVHEQGYAVMDAADFMASKVLQLRPWARIEGTLYIGSGPGLNEKVSVNLSHQGYDQDQPRIHWAANTKTDSLGYFMCDRVFPGSLSVSHMIWTSVHTTSAAQSQTIEVAAGDTGFVEIGGKGCPIVGRLVLPEGLDTSGRWGPFGLRIHSQTTRAREPE